jgi:hypothetical protein
MSRLRPRCKTELLGWREMLGPEFSASVFPNKWAPARLQVSGAAGDAPRHGPFVDSQITHAVRLIGVLTS